MSENTITTEKLGINAARHMSRVLGNRIYPIGKLQTTIHEKNWFEGLILSCTYFDMFGFLSLKTYYEQVGNVDLEHGKEIAKFLSRAYLATTMKLLYICGLVRPNTYEKMKRINAARNKLVHPEKLKDNVFIFEEETDPKFEERAKKLIEDAIDCLKELGAMEQHTGA